MGSTHTLAEAGVLAGHDLPRSGTPVNWQRIYLIVGIACCALYSNKGGPFFAQLRSTAGARPRDSAGYELSKEPFMEQDKHDALIGGPQTYGYKSEQASGSSTANSLKDTVASKLHDVAGVIQQKAIENQNPTLSTYAGQAANWIDDAAEYVREADPQKLKSDVQNQVRRNPGRSLLVAGAAGLLLGFLIRR